MIPQVREKKEDSRHECEFCGKQMSKGTKILRYKKNNPYNKNGDTRQMHFSCFMSKNAKELHGIVKDELLKEAMVNTIMEEL